MKREIHIPPMAIEKIWEELRHALAYAAEAGIDCCEFSLGYAWAIDYYPDNNRVAETLPLADVVPRILELEQRGLGRFGCENLYLAFPEFMILFCHESDIHLQFEQPNTHTEHFLTRWEAMGLQPKQYLKQAQGADDGLLPGEFE